MHVTHILVVDDEPNLRRSLEMILQSAGYAVTLAASAAEAEKFLSERQYEVMLLDIVMPDRDGMQFLQSLKGLPHRPVVVMISGNATIQNAVAATREGAYDFLEKPIAKEKLLLAVNNALTQRRLLEENARLRRELAAGFEMLGDSPALQQVREQIARVAPVNTRVLILGESGTGKELAARAIHAASERSRAAFVKVNCAAIPEDLIESELFGHEKGAFTGATAAREGKFELADRGTLFLDEVGDMSLKVQAKVLRVLQEGEFERVGGSQTRRVDVRVITATNKNLEQEVRHGRFREDLWYRLNVVPIVMPPLRERRSDIPLLIEHFVARFCQENGFKRKRLEPDAIKKLMDYSWPGNIRELKNAIERLVIMTPQETITAADVPLSLQMPHSSLRPAAPLGTSLEEVRKQAERDYIAACLQAVDGNVTRAAQLLGLERSHLYKKMKALGMQV
ncbi:MAG: sigma-54 dependent transcriptional regulator [candidate division KSB1 bacterium]|nr:sigma-54 dependent transcriptional regulator [candidate division KSB1 bacterium]MDZ7275203.1 sigma-54 dependent transcriptional regulator [candidate division KSB1 bacterium]MDZ7287372.1 sigma-54 dependent transcriptional regulator [candidate division KSB1 bacterium]MDZ7299486.1 sigma-54 dependent transcriptional regulator [candidate division KSB1 bacterium]MDZ7305468.1 sigma-54 dependent transcriptional regulator [candidate division KSB1 bacterium]